MSLFGTNLRNIRLSRGLTQQELAELLGSNQASITAWERGPRTPPLVTITRIAEMLNVPLSALISIEETGKETDGERSIIDLVNSNHKIKELLNRIRFLSDSDIDVVLNVVSAMTRDVYEK